MAEYIKNCKDCGREFRTENERRKLCDNCRLEHKRESGRKASKQQSKIFKKSENRSSETKRRKQLYRDGLSINSFMHLLERYNRRNGTRYSYGQAMMHLSTGIIRKEEFYL